jgi:hypothetical protein
MTGFEVPEAIICSPFEEPAHYWYLEEGREPEKRGGRGRPSTTIRSRQLKLPRSTE